jgi:hypothetical protein
MKTIITEKQLDTLKNIRELSFRKIRSFTDASLASGIEEINITNVNKKIRCLLLEFFTNQENPKRGDRVKTQNIFIQTRKGKEICWIVTYRALHGCGYAWSQDAEGEFKQWLIKNYNIKRTSKTYKNILSLTFNY